MASRRPSGATTRPRTGSCFRTPPSHRLAPTSPPGTSRPASKRAAAAAMGPDGREMLARPRRWGDHRSTCMAIPKTPPATVLDVLRDPEIQRLLDSPEHMGVELSHSRQIYANRWLQMDQIALLGFDMDYTLAVYSLRQIEELAFRMTLDRLVASRGYHGRRQLSLDERRALYQTNEKIRLSLPRFAWIDTLFSLPEACLYAEIIETQEARGEKVDYHKVYDDTRESIDEVHRDGSLKTEVRKDLARFIKPDPELAPALHKLRSGGKKLFVLTNSLWDYTEAVMSFLLDGRLPEYPTWRNYFDYVVVGAQKPAFFAEQRPFIELNPDGTIAKAPPESLERGKIYEGGNLFDFERMTGFAGERVLYVGDHIYGDIIRNRKASQWRTCFVVQELEREIEYIDAHAENVLRLKELDDLRTRLDDMINHHKLLLNALDRRMERGGPLPADLEARRQR